MPRPTVVPLCFALAATLAGCSSALSPAYMREVDPARQLRAPADQALVVFVRAAPGLETVAAHVMDEKLNFLGTALAGGHFSVLRPPGRQWFVVWAQGEDILVADLAPGLVYFVEVNPVAGEPRQRFAFKTSHRGTNLFPYQEEWLQNTRQYWVDPKDAKAEMAKSAGERREKLLQAGERLKKYVNMDLYEHMLSPTDGHASVGVPGEVRVSVVPLPLPGVGAQPVAAPAPLPATAAGFVPDDFPPPPPPGPPPELAHDAVPRGFARGTRLKVKLKNGASLTGEVMRETRVDLKLKVGNDPQLVDFDDIASIDQLRGK